MVTQSPPLIRTRTSTPRRSSGPMDPYQHRASSATTVSCTGDLVSTTHSEKWKVRSSTEIPNFLSHGKQKYGISSIMANRNTEFPRPWPTVYRFMDKNYSVQCDVSILINTVVKQTLNKEVVIHKIFLIALPPPLPSKCLLSNQNIFTRN